MTAQKDTFPRTADLPTQSPIFWVEQKDRYLRQLLIRDIEAITHRRLVVYFANRYESAQIEPRDVAYMTELLGDLDGSPFDLLVETSGGFTDATESLVQLIKNTNQDFRTIVANAAKSNGTLLCLASKEIVMGSPSQLGPIEPLVQNIPCSILLDQRVATENFFLHKFGEYALQQTKTMATVLLTNGMMRDRAAEVPGVVHLLASRDKYFSHGAVIDHQEASSLGLKVQYLGPDDDVWKRIWLLHCLYDSDSRKSRYLKVFEGRSRSTAIVAPPATTGAPQGP